MKDLYFRKHKFILLFFTAFIISAIAFGFSLNLKNAKADVLIDATLFHPDTAMEYKELSSPIDAYFWDDKIAIIQGADNKLLVYNDGVYSEKQFTTLKQVKKFDDQTLIVSDNQSSPKYYKVNFQNLNQVEELTIGGSHFDLNGEYLVSAYSTTVTVYNLTDTTFSNGLAYNNKIDSDTPVCINSDNKVFFIHNSKLYFSQINDMGNETLVSEQKPTSILADSDFVYYSVGSKIYKKSLSDLSIPETELTLNATAFDKSSNPYAEYDLGKLSSPTSLSFKDGNLLVTDKIDGTIQEFEIDQINNQLLFTGFAVTKNKTAFNRIGATNIEIEQNNKMTAVLDSLKLTLIYDDENGKEYKNVLVNETGVTPQYLALGNNTVLLSENTTDFVIVDVATQSVSQTLSVGQSGDSITDVCYNDGKYYILIKSGSNTAVYTANESDFTTTKILDGPATNTGNPVLTVDVDGNVYLTDDYNDNIKKYTLTQSGYDALATEINFSATGVKKLFVDLAGNIFALKNNAIEYYDGTTTETYTVTLPVNKDITSISMSFDKDQAHLICQGEEMIFDTVELPNLTLADIEKTTDYKVSGESADINDLKIYTVKENAFVYSVKANQTGFDFIEIIDGTNGEYVLIYEYAVGGQTFSILASENNGKNVEVIINKRHLVEKQDVLSSTEFTVAYVTTDVNLYYLPIITLNDNYCVKHNDSPVRLKKKTPFTINNSLEFLGRQFYFATVEIDGVSITGYIPQTFTVETLSQHVLSEKFYFATINNAIVYSDETLQTKVAQIEEDTTVKVYENKDGIALVSFESSDGAIVIGYVSSDAIITPPNTVIRNVLIILLVTLSVSLTSIYFIIKKKN